VVVLVMVVVMPLPWVTLTQHDGDSDSDSPSIAATTAFVQHQETSKRRPHIENCIEKGKDDRDEDRKKEIPGEEGGRGKKKARKIPTDAATRARVRHTYTHARMRARAHTHTHTPKAGTRKRACIRET